MSGEVQRGGAAAGRRVDLVDGPPPAGASGRVAVAGERRYCRFAGDRVVLLDRPAWEPGATAEGEAAFDDVRLLAPAEPGKVVAVGLNYRAHADELSMDTRSEPILFLKPSTTVVGPGDDIVCPARSARVDYEAELVLVVGRRCRHVTPAQAAGYVAGYTCGNDVTARDLQQLDGQWTRAKSFDTFCPLGPWILPAAPSPAARVSALLDGVEVQHGSVADMIVSPLELLSFVSGVMTLEPGDAVMTGTPSGIGPMRPGQTATVEVEGIGRLSNPVV